MLLTKNTNNLDPTVYTNSDLELIRKLKLRNLPRTLRELIIEESIVMFLVKNNVYTKKVIEYNEPTPKFFNKHNDK